MELTNVEKEIILKIEDDIVFCNEEIKRLSNRLHELQKARIKLSNPSQDTIIDKAKDSAKKIQFHSINNNYSKYINKIDVFLDSVGGSATLKDIGQHLGKSEQSASKYLKTLGYTQVCRGRYAKWGIRKQ